MAVYKKPNKSKTEWLSSTIFTLAVPTSPNSNLYPPLLHRKLQKRPCNDRAPVRLANPVDTVLVNLVPKDTGIVPGGQNMRYHFPVELWMPLHGEEFVLGIHALVCAAGRVRQRQRAFWIREHHVLVHLVYALPNFCQS